jgi:DNA polymerase elongation subunit (family B)
MSKSKILLFDIEISPSLGYTWQKWEANVLEYEKEWYMLSFSAKWLGDKKFITKGLCDYKTYKTDKTDDGELVRELWKLFDEADIIVAHNGDAFDIKKANARFLYHELNPPSPYRTVDTKKVAKRYFSFNSNSLNDLGKLLNLGVKLQHTGFEMWLGCMAGIKSSWKQMLDYNKQDVVLLEKVYLELRNWMTNHPNLNLITEEIDACPICNEKKLQKRGFGVTRTMKYQRLQCQACGGWCRGRAKKVENFEIR